MIGLIIDGKYRIDEAIGEGGMSSIYRAEHLGMDRQVAIKVLHPSLAEDPEAIARLKHEAEVVATIAHANICKVFDMGRTRRGSPYLVMELLLGQSLAERLKAKGAMHFLDLAPLLEQVLAALQGAHDKGILHRDLKPENVFVQESPHRAFPTAKLLDFGISKSMSYGFQEEQRLTHTGMVMGTPYYMAPEQARGDSGLDQRVDLWAVGVMMYEALTGRRPFVATNYNALLVKILTSRPRAIQKLVPTIENVVAEIVDKALSKLREDRFQSAHAFLAALSRAQQICARGERAGYHRVHHASAQASPTPARAAHEQPHAAHEQPHAAHEQPHAAHEQPHVARGSAKRWQIEDPAAFIDDDFEYDSSQMPGRAPEGSPPPRHSAYGDSEKKSAETAREGVWRREAPPPEPGPKVRQTTGDTAVIRRPAQPPGSGSGAMFDTDVMKRAPMFSEHEKTEVIRDMSFTEIDAIRGGAFSQSEHTQVIKQELFTDADKTDVVGRSKYEDPVPPDAVAGDADRKNVRRGGRLVAPRSQAKTDPVRSAAKSKAKKKRKKKRKPRTSSASTQQPRVPRPDPKPDDEERTTFFNPARARALRAEANGDEDSSGNGEQ